MPTVKATFNGQVFVPCEAVQLPAGTHVEVLIPARPRKPTAEDNRIWQDIVQQLDASPPYFPTLDDAMRYSRKHP